jgi:outer membrane biosynthesis protein TonB
MKNDKSESLGVVEDISRFTGVFVGKLVVWSKVMANRINDMTKPKPGTTPEQKPKPEIESIPKPEPMVSPKIIDKSVKSPVEKKSGQAKKGKKKRKSKNAKVKKKKVEAKRSSGKSFGEESVETN